MYPLEKVSAMKDLVEILIENSDAETAKITIQAFSGILLLLAIVAGNWNFIS